MKRWIILASLLSCESSDPPYALDLHFPEDLQDFDRNRGIDGTHCKSSPLGWTMELQWSTPITDFYSCWIRSQHPVHLAESTVSAELQLHYQLRNHSIKSADDYAQIMVTLSTTEHTQEQAINWELQAEPSDNEGWMTVAIEPSILQEPIDLRVLLSLNRCDDPTEPSCGRELADPSDFPRFIINTLRISTTS